MTALAEPMRRMVRPLLTGGAALLLAAPSAGWAVAPGDGGPVPLPGDSVVVVVSSRSPVTEISRSHLVDLYLGRAARFPDGRPAVPVDQSSGSPSREGFYERYVGRTPAEVKAHWSRIIFTGRGRPPRDVASDLEMNEVVGNDSSAIGYLDRRHVGEALRIVRVVH